MILIHKSQSSVHFFGKGTILTLSETWTYFEEVTFPKLHYVMKHPAGLLFLQNEQFWRFKTYPFWRNLTFANILWKYWPRHSKRPSGATLEALRRFPGVLLGDKSALKGKCDETIMFFFCKSDATDHFCCRGAKVTCTKYHACAQKLSAVFTNGSGSSARPVLPTPPEPLQINLFGEWYGHTFSLDYVLNQTNWLPACPLDATCHYCPCTPTAS